MCPDQAMKWFTGNAITWSDLIGYSLNIALIPTFTVYNSFFFFFVVLFVFHALSLFRYSFSYFSSFFSWHLTLDTDECRMWLMQLQCSVRMVSNKSRKMEHLGILYITMDTNLKIIIWKWKLIYMLTNLINRMKWNVK